jgi:hypothetical protein
LDALSLRSQSEHLVDDTVWREDILLGNTLKLSESQPRIHAVFHKLNGAANDLGCKVAAYDQGRFTHGRVPVIW